MENDNNFKVKVKTISWREFNLQDVSFQKAHSLATETWNDYFPDDEYMVLLEVIPIQENN